jgi:hypothetical protein
MTTVDEAFLTLTRLWTERDRLRRSIDAIAALIEAHGCECVHHCATRAARYSCYCEPCLACRVNAHVTEALR